MSRRVRSLLAATLAGLLALVACGQPEPSTPSANGSGQYPITLQNCGQQVRIEQRPERVFVISDTPVSLLASVDALDTVIGKAGPFRAEYFDSETAAALDRIPTVGTSTVDGKGHVEISLETLLAAKPDLLLGYLPDGVTRAGLAQAGIPVLLPPGSCEDPAQIPADRSLEEVYQQVELYGRVFDAEQKAAAVVADLRERIAAVGRSTDHSRTRTAAALYVYLGGASPSAYGKRSLVHAQLAAVGLTNVFARVDGRVFEMGTEQLLAANPDALVLLCVECPPGAIEASVRAIPGIGSVNAVRNNQILVLPFRMTEPPSPLVVTGMEMMAQAFRDGR